MISRLGRGYQSSHSAHRHESAVAASPTHSSPPAETCFRRRRRRCIECISISHRGIHFRKQVLAHLLDIPGGRQVGLELLVEGADEGIDKHIHEVEPILQRTEILVAHLDGLLRVEDRAAELPGEELGHGLEEVVSDRDIDVARLVLNGHFGIGLSAD
jgi:hypothetical protein